MRLIILIACGLLLCSCRIVGAQVSPEWFVTDADSEWQEDCEDQETIATSSWWYFCYDPVTETVTMPDGEVMGIDEFLSRNNGEYNGTK